MRYVTHSDDPERAIRSLDAMRGAWDRRSKATRRSQRPVAPLVDPDDIAPANNPAEDTHDTRHLAEQDWLDWCAMDRPEDAGRVWWLDYLARLEELGHSPKAAKRLLREAKSNRIGRLKGAGNAIVPQVAALFIRAYMQTLEEPACPTSPI